MATSKPVRSQFPVGKIGDRKYQLALKRYNESQGTAKPAAKPALSSEGIKDYAGRGADTKTVPTGSSPYNAARNKQIEAERQRLKGVGNPPASTSTQSTSTAPKPKPKPPTKPQPAANAGMKNQDKNYKGSYVKNFKEETGRMGAAGLSRQQGRSNLTSEDLKPKDIRKVRTGTDFGGAGGANSSEPATGQSVGGTKTPSQSNKEAKKPMTLAEKIRRRRMGLD